jgi:NAD(P) transhydrogenase subunit alpha
MLRIGVVREIAPGETRVAIVPDVAGRLAKGGFEVLLETGAGRAAMFEDKPYADAGVKVLPTAAEVFAQADVVLKVREPWTDPARGVDEAAALREGSALIAFLNPSQNGPLFERLAQRRVTALSMELVPRITRAQKMDALSSMSTVAGYKAALLAASTLARFYPLLMTAAGTIAPARVFVLGAGVAGLQVIATSRRIGAVVEAFDVRPAVREEVQSLGATFVAADLTDAAHSGEGGYAKALSADQEEKERALIRKHVAGADVVVTTAMVPGRRAPVLVTEEMVREMKTGSVIVDMAAETGGNCALTRPGETVVAHGVTIHGPVTLAASLPVHASQMYARNVVALLQHVVKDGALHIDLADEITKGCCVTHDGRVLYGAPAAAAPPQPVAAGAPGSPS